MLTWLIVAYDDDSGRVVGGDEDGGDGGRGDDDGALGQQIVLTLGIKLILCV